MQVGSKTKTRRLLRLLQLWHSKMPANTGKQEMLLIPNSLQNLSLKFLKTFF